MRERVVNREIRSESTVTVCINEGDERRKPALMLNAPCTHSAYASLKLCKKGVVEQPLPPPKHTHRICERSYLITIGCIYLLCSIPCDRSHLSLIKCCTVEILPQNALGSLVRSIFKRDKPNVSVVHDVLVYVTMCSVPACHFHNKCSIPFEHSH